MKILVKRGIKAFPRVLDPDEIREDSYYAERNKVGRAVCALSCVFRLKQNRAPQYLRVMPEDLARELEQLRVQIRGLRAHCDEIIDEAWRHADPYVVPKPARKENA